jgi:hypothetical protein
MKISLFTCNLANSAQPPNLTRKDPIACSPDIYIEMTQEDYRPLNSGSVFSPLVFPADLKLVAIQSLNSGPTTQNVVIRMYSWLKFPYETGKKAIAAKGKKDWKFQAQKALSFSGIGLGVSKGAVWIKAYIPRPVLFVCMHLPMKKNAPGLGFEIRKNALYNLIGELAPLIDQETSVFIGGDLNFRMEYNGKNQLTNELTNMRYLKELPFLDEKDKIFTCKFKPIVNKKKSFNPFKLFKTSKVVPNNKENCTIRRSTSIGINSEEVKDLQTECGDLHRIPSRCDRFLYRLGAKKTLNTIYQTGGPLIGMSDHNAMWACFELNDDASSTDIPVAWPQKEVEREVGEFDDEDIESDLTNPKAEQERLALITTAPQGTARTHRRRHRNRRSTRRN